MKPTEKTGPGLWAAFRCIKRSWGVYSLAASILIGICLGLVAMSTSRHHDVTAENAVQSSAPGTSLSAPQAAGTRLVARPRPPVAPHPKRADFEGEPTSGNARQVADAGNAVQSSAPGSSLSAPQAAGTRSVARPRPPVAPHPKRADFEGEPTSGNARQVADAGNAVQSSTAGTSLSVPQAAGTRLVARPRPPVAPHPKRADFEGEPTSGNARQVADWVADSRDNHGMPFAIIDKAGAKVFVFDADGRLRGATPALLGLARGDFPVRGIGDRALADIRPDERTTPAGRFVASLGFNAKRTDVLWVDYKNAVSLHRVVTNNPKERRLERLATPTALDKRISYGCINVPASFFDHVVKPAFTGSYGIVYVLPETRSIGEIFKSYYDVELRWGSGTNADIDEHPKLGLQQQDVRFARP